MSVLSEIKELIKLVAFNRKVAIVTVIAILIIGVGGYFYLKYKPDKPESDCVFIKQQNKELLAFILEAQRQVKELAQPTSFIMRDEYFSFASFDTIPKSKPQQQQQRAAILLNKFDSVLLKVKQDSIDRSKKKQ